MISRDSPLHLPVRMMAMTRARVLAHLAVFTSLMILLCIGIAQRPIIWALTYGNESELEATSITDLELLGVSRNIDYTRCDMVVSFGNPDSASNDRLDAPLPESHAIDLYALAMPALQPPTIEIEVSKPLRKSDASHIVFGVATTLRRLEESLNVFSHWAGGSKTRLYAIVDIEDSQTPLSEMSRIQKSAAALGFDLQVTASTDEYNDRYFSLVKLLFEQREDAQWAGIIDDDTMFPSISALIARLDEYDTTLPQYIGGVSEDLVQMGLWGYMAYGGAGIFISMPLLHQMNNDHVYGNCSDAREWSGDRRIAHCVYSYTDTKLTVEHDLHQVDIHGDASGFYESGRRLPLSLHHWKEWFDVDMSKLTAVAKICGDSCLLRRWRFSNGWFLNNGFSLVKYGNDIPDGDNTMEKTWDDYSTASDDSYVHSLAPLRPKDLNKVVYRLEDVKVQRSIVRQFYVHRSISGTNDRVAEITWRIGR